jgi:hypothetical protein
MAKHGIIPNTIQVQFGLDLKLQQKPISWDCGLIQILLLPGYGEK